MRQFTPWAPLALLLASVAGCGSEKAGSGEAEAGGSTSGQVYATPEAAYADFQKALNANDLGKAARLMIPESQTMMAFPMIMHASFMTIDDPQKQKSLNDLLAKHGLDLEDEGAEDDAAEAGPSGPEEVLKPVKDVPQLLGALGAWIQANGTEEDREGFPRLGALSEVTINGELATATFATEDMPQPIRFHRVNGSWLVEIPDGRDSAAEATGEYSAEADSDTPSLGTLTIGEKVHQLRHAIAYHSKFFDDPCIVVYLTTKPVSEKELQGLKKMLAEEGNDDSFHVWHPQVKLTFDEAHELMFINSWADNMSLSGTPGKLDAELSVEDGRVVGKAHMSQPDNAFDSTYQISVEFDTELLSAK